MSIKKALNNEILPNRKERPIKIVQFGEGNFLMSFFDWMVYQAIKALKYDGSIALTCPLDYD